MAIGFTIMAFNSLYQYSWNALSPLLERGLNVGLFQISIAFSLFTIFSSISQPFGGGYADVHGPKGVGILSAVLSAIGFLGTYFTPNIQIFYVFWSLGSIGEGILYGIATNLGVKWFKQRTALVTGLISLGFGIGSIVVNPIIFYLHNFREIVLYIGLVEIVVLPLLLFLIDYPKNTQGKGVRETTLSTSFWILYVSFIASSTPLLVVSSSLSAIGFYLPKLQLETIISVFPLTSGLGRPIFGEVGDKIGILKSTILINIVEEIGSLSLFYNPIIAAILIGISGGSAATLYFNISGLIFGKKFSTANNGILYTGKALSGIIGSSIFSLIFLFSTDIAYIFVSIFPIIALSLIIIIIKKYKVS
nr:MFS transporter [Candidatus Acidianus copahuensis]